MYFSFFVSDQNLEAEPQVLPQEISPQEKVLIDDSEVVEPTPSDDDDDDQGLLPDIVRDYQLGVKFLADFCPKRPKTNKFKSVSLLMAQWVDMEAEKSLTERMLVRDRPT